MLNKAKILKGYKLNSLDGEIGKVNEFYFDDKHWTIRYLVANAGNWLTGRHRHYNRQGYWAEPAQQDIIGPKKRGSSGN